MNAREPAPLPATAVDLREMVEAFFRESFSTDNALITEAVRRMLAAGGKRLRPRIALLAAEAVGAEPRDHLALASYMELIHVGTLIHDDVVDQAQTRRGVNATAVDYGNRISVLAGDYLFAWIYKNVTAAYPHPIPHLLAATLADITDGEVMQLRAAGNLDLSVAGYVEIVDRKTASLFAASAACGATAGGGGPAPVAGLREFGRLYGIAFQMRDDVLDVAGNASELGKPVGTDVRERKMTLPVIHALAASSGAVRARIADFYAGSGEHPAAIADVVQAIRESGGLVRTRESLAGYVENAKTALARLPEGSARTQLAGVADALLAS